MQTQIISGQELHTHHVEVEAMACNKGLSLLSKEELQELQDKFSSASGLYTICFGRNVGVLTSFSGPKRDRSVIEQIIGKNYFYNVLRQIRQCDDSEEVYVGDTKYPFIKVAGVNVVIGGVNVASWIVTAIIDDDVTTDEEKDIVKFFSRTVTRDEFYKSIDFLHTVSKKLFYTPDTRPVSNLSRAAEYFSADGVKQEKRRNKAMTEIVQLLESDGELEDILNKALSSIGHFLDISNSFILKINNERNTADMIAEWVNKGIKPQIKNSKNISIPELVYVGRYPCIISSNTDIPDFFDSYMERNQLQALISFPIEINGKLVMSLVFQETRCQKVWDPDTIKFLFDIKKIIQSIVSKRINTVSIENTYDSIESVLESLGCGIFICDRTRKELLYANERIKIEFSKAFQQGSFDDMFKRCSKENNGSNYMELHYEEENRWYEIHYTPIAWVDGREVSLCTAFDITDRKIYQKKIEQQANNDFLTGLYNRMRCETDLAEIIENAVKADAEGALIYIDLDDFKTINDDLGHHYGDVLLKTISEELKTIEGVERKCYRMGGDEFVAIVSHENYDRINNIIEDIQEVFSKPWFLYERDCYCTMSMGIAIFPQEGTSVLDIMKKADIALYEAKRRGKNCVEFYDKTSESASHKRLDMETNMRKATANDCSEFQVYYQPLFDMKRPGVNKCCGAEALIRWNSSQLGFISPSEFIPLAEYLGLINPIGNYVLEKACEDCKRWNDEGHDFKVNVNLSVVQLLQNNIEDSIHRVIEKTGINPKNLTLEVTESLAINDMERMKAILGRLRLLGVRIALDDFGTGYSSLNHIREIPLDVIKLDQCFIAGIQDDDYARAFVKMVTELANAIGVTVCVEGVETAEQQQILKDMNIRLHQGYFYDKPMPCKEFEERYLDTYEAE